MQGLPGIERVNDMGKVAELSLSPEADPQVLLKLLVNKLDIQSFSIKAPSLHEVFVRTVGGAVE